MDQSPEESSDLEGSIEAADIKPLHENIDETKISDHIEIKDEDNKEDSAVEMEDKHEEKSKEKAAPINCMEKIIIFIDISWEMSNISLTSVRQETFLQYIKGSLEMFLSTKNAVNPLHEYALALVQNDSVFWCHEFTNQLDTIQDIIEGLEPTDTPKNNDEQDIFYFDSIIQLIKDHCQLPEVGDHLLTPPYVIRCILIFGRSHCTPQISLEQKAIFKQFKDSPFFFIDILYLHDSPTQDNKAQEIYQFFCDLDKDETGYVLEVSNSVQRLYDNMAKLICHPLQRSPQTEAFYDLIPLEDPNSVNKI
eukprot:gene7999-8858_t